MKIVLTVLLLFLTLVFTNCEKEPEINPDNPVNIPDDMFLNSLIKAGVDTNGDGIISSDEAQVITYLDLDGRGISDMTGIEAFVNLVELNCSFNHFTSLDVSNNTAIERLSCGQNQLTSLDVSNSPALKELYCSGNQLTTLDVSNNTALTDLESGSNLLTTLDVSKNTVLTSFGCGNNPLTSLDVSNSPALRVLYCSFNHFTSLDVSNNTVLEGLSCRYNQLATLDVSNNIALISLSCGNNQLTSLDVSNNTEIRWLPLNDMPSLEEVCVWITPFPPEGVKIDTTNSPNVHFTTECQ